MWKDKHILYHILNFFYFIYLTETMSINQWPPSPEHWWIVFVQTKADAPQWIQTHNNIHGGGQALYHSAIQVQEDLYKILHFDWLTVINCNSCLTKSMCCPYMPIPTSFSVYNEDQFVLTFGISIVLYSTLELCFERYKITIQIKFIIIISIFRRIISSLLAYCYWGYCVYNALQMFHSWP